MGAVAVAVLLSSEPRLTIQELPFTSQGRDLSERVFREFVDSPQNALPRIPLTNGHDAKNTICYKTENSDE